MGPPRAVKAPLRCVAAMDHWMIASNECRPQGRPTSNQHRWHAAEPDSAAASFEERHGRLRRAGAKSDGGGEAAKNRSLQVSSQARAHQLAPARARRMKRAAGLFPLALNADGTAHRGQVAVRAQGRNAVLNCRPRARCPPVRARRADPSRVQASRALGLGARALPHAPARLEAPPARVLARFHRRIAGELLAGLLARLADFSA